MSSVSQLWKIAVDAPIKFILTYSNKDLEQKPEMGQWVQVPLGQRKVPGLCLGPAEESQQKETFVVKSIHSIDSEYPPWSDQFLGWLEWLSNYYIHPPGLVAALALPPLRKNPKSKTRKSAVVPELEQENSLQLNDEQRVVVEKISKVSGFSTHLIFGVTGSGKTEIYLQLLEKILAEGKTGLVLVPEIALTPQLIQRFARRFGDQIAVLHSQLTERERTNQWWGIVEGRKKILIGARSALFCPIPNLGLIVVDEEHEPSYKQDEKLKYHGRDAAIMLGKFMDCPVLLGSATPSLESWKNALEGKYHLHQLKNRVADRSLPQFTVIDFKQKNSSQNDSQATKKTTAPTLPFWMSLELYEALGQQLEKGDQSALFLNRRGLAQMVVCPACGHTRECPNCDISLTLHANTHLICHYCDYHENFKTLCPDCKEGELKPLGIGTELVESDLQKLFPSARIARADRDEIQNRQELEALISQMEKGEIDFLIGTQMIAKGLDFPKLKLVAFVLADVGFNFPDFRATERSFQLLTQMSGRSGRHILAGETPGQVLVQTYNREHESLVRAQKTDYVGFAEQELLHRKALNYPPYGRLICFRVQSAKLGEAQESIKQLAQRAQALKAKYSAYENLEILGPAEAPLSRIRGQFRFHLLLKGAQARILNQFSRQVLSDEKWFSSSVKVLVDIDPIHLL
ncbi:MAG: primosomal protein N' [Bdellovibrionota bacterium]